MLEKEIECYKNHQEELLKLYRGRYLVIKGERILGVYDSFEKAYLETRKQHNPRTFLIQLCEEGRDVYVKTFQARLPVRYVASVPDFIIGSV